MKRQPKRNRQRSAAKTSRIERLAAKVERYLLALDRNADELDTAAKSMEIPAFTPGEAEALGATYTMMPIRLLLLATRIMMDGTPPDSGFDRSQIIEMAERWGVDRARPSEMANESIDLLRRLTDYLEENTPELPEEETGIPPIH